MDISVSNGHHCAEKDQFQYLKDCGFDACDFSLGAYFERGAMFGDMSTLTDEMIKSHFTMLKSEADKAGFRVGQTHSAFTGHPRNYDFDIDEIVQRQIASIKATHFLGSKYCIIHPIILPGRRYDLKVKEAFDASYDFYSRLTDTLERYDVYCCVENMWVSDPVHRHICSTIFSHAQEMVDMCDKLGDRFKICVDTGHGLLTQDDPCEMIRISGDKLAALHVHENDGLGDLHTFPFASYTSLPDKKVLKTDWTDMMQALKDVNYKGTFNFEISIPGPKELHAAGLKYLSAIGRYLTSL